MGSLFNSFAHPGIPVRIVGGGGLLFALASVVAQFPEGPDPDQWNDADRQAVRAVCEEVPDRLPPLDVQRVAVVVPLQDDDTRIVTYYLREALRDSMYKPPEPGAASWLTRRFNYAMGQPPARSASEAAEVARAKDARFAIWGRVLKLNDESVQFELNVTDAEGQPVGEPITLPGTAADRVTISAIDMTNGKYFSGVVVFTLLWPLVLIPLMRRVIRVENNGLTLVVLIAMTAVPAALVYPWAFGSLYSVVRAVIWFAILAIVFLWCSYVLSRAASMVSY